MSLTLCLYLPSSAGLERIMNYVLGHGGAISLFWVWARMMIPVMVASAFVNNTRE